MFAATEVLFHRDGWRVRVTVHLDGGLRPFAYEDARVWGCLLGEAKRLSVVSVELLRWILVEMAAASPPVAEISIFATD